MSLPLFALRLPAARLSSVLLLLHMLRVPELRASCTTPSLSEDAILAKVQVKILQDLGLAEAPRSCNQTDQVTWNPFNNPGLERRLTRWISRQTHNEDGDTSEVISFPVTSVPCDVQHKGFVGDHSYIFQPSAHSRKRLVTSAEFWFYTGVRLPSPVTGAQPPAELYFLIGDSFVRVAVSEAVEGKWATFHISEPFLPYVTHRVLLLQVKCPSCQCVADQANLPFILSSTKSSRPSRTRRSTVPWSPAYVNLLQRPPSPDLIHDDCHRSAVNISFEELGWGNWIVQPRSFTFYYCNGTCSNSNRLTSSLGLKVCCSSVPSSMKPLRVRTTSNGGFSFKYETIPNIITKECTCI